MGGKQSTSEARNVMPIGSPLRSVRAQHVSISDISSAGIDSLSSYSRTTVHPRARARSLVSFQPSERTSSIPIPPHGNFHFEVADSESSNSDDGNLTRPSMQSLPLHFLALHSRLGNFSDLKCPVCSKTVPSDEIECHLITCLTKPKITYNDDVLTEDKGECVICFEDLQQGDTIARLPCLCIYHKRCIDEWFRINRSCPEHPAD